MDTLETTTAASFNLIFALSPWVRLRGLIGHRPSWLGEDDVLVLAPCNSVHTYGMNDPIDIAFADSKGVVLKSCRTVMPRRRVRCPGASMTLERFATGHGDSPWLEVGSRIAAIAHGPHSSC